MSIVIDKIVFENYRQYGSGSLSFHAKNKKLSALIAKNGTGKTTLLNAITWCLYGKELHLNEKKTSLPLVNSAVLRSSSVGSMIPVSIAITVIDGANIVEFSRKIDFKINSSMANGCGWVKGASELTVTKTIIGEFTNTTVLTDSDAELIVKQYFDEAIFKFYFFDGEKLGDFFIEDQANTVQQSIFNISQIAMLENACKRLKKIDDDKTRKLANNNPNIAILTKDRDDIEKKINNAKAMYDDNQTECNNCEKDLEQFDAQLRGYEPVKKLQEERKELEDKFNEIENEEKRYLTRRGEFIRYYYVLLSLYPRIKHTLDMIKRKEADGDLPPAIDKDQVRRLLEHLDEPCPLCNGVIGETGREHLESLLERISVSSHTSNFLKEIKGALEIYVENGESFKEKLNELRQDGDDIKARKDATATRIQEISSLLTNYGSENDHLNIAKIEAKRKSVRDRLKDLNTSSGLIRNDIKYYEECFARKDKDLKAAIQTANTNKDIKNQVEVIHTLFEKFSEVKKQIMDEMRIEIENTTWSIFDSMIWKKQTFGEIKIDDLYNVTVYSTDGVEMTGSLSATEQMALAYAFTLAIHKASGKNCPLVIDSPLGRVSDDNRENMARALQKISQEKQIIMLFTPDEYSAPVRALYDGMADVRELSLSEDESHVEGIEV